MPCLRFKSGAVLTFSSVARMLDFVDSLGEEGRRELRKLLGTAPPVLQPAKPDALSRPSPEETFNESPN